VSDQATALGAVVDETIHNVRRISSELRPAILDDLGLVDALEWHAEEFEKRTGIKCTVKAARRRIEAGPDLGIALFRICQEALTNVARHARATAVRIVLARNRGHVVLEVHDNGAGIPPAVLTGAKSLDHPIVRRGLREILEQAGAPVTVGEAASAVEGLALARKQSWDTVVLDITMPGRGAAGPGSGAATSTTVRAAIAATRASTVSGRSSRRGFKASAGSSCRIRRRIVAVSAGSVRPAKAKEVVCASTTLTRTRTFADPFVRGTGASRAAPLTAVARAGGPQEPLQPSGLGPPRAPDATGRLPSAP